MLRRNECRLNFKNRPVRTGDLKGGPKQPPLPLIEVARSLPLIGLKYLILISPNKATVSNVGTCLKLQSESGSAIFYLFRFRLQEKLRTPTDSGSSFDFNFSRNCLLRPTLNPTSTPTGGNGCMCVCISNLKSKRVMKITR